ncbi:hypothetical protein [Tepidibacter aestuarii]|uniref:hypothetical protein n=1 Tax=Tepidibacter aestuarii TaxID=2925782 RepID=UPI0020BEBF3C|nr:hypothetical protein [Tepidibacter aestuarii]CAH2213440.1 conserved protein of unknown function [Tepidibacter aestuarii]
MSENKICSCKRKKSRNVLINILIFMISIGLWGGIVYYGYGYAKNYIDTSINNVRQENAMNIQGLSDQVKLLSNEIKELSDSLDDTDSTISNTTDVQNKIDNKLEELDDRLKELQKSLDILKEAPNAEN